MKNIVIGTSGHIDHGKSALVKALTGTDPDRFEEEKRRGITIDLGFAHYIWKDSLDVSFVDVPGHERFVHNMLAGIGGIQILILVIAADGGVMPQTKEHLHICNLLGIKQGIVVITRCDLAEEEMIELVEEEATELVQSTFLEGMPIIKTSIVTGEGLDSLREEIARQAGLLSDDFRRDGFRLPVDRSFSLKGFGTVITGTVLSGQASVKDTLILYPEEKPLKIRGFQVHQQSVEQIFAGQRSAINLSGIHKDEILRGSQVSLSGQLVKTQVIEVEMSIIPEKTGILKNRSKIRFFSSAQEVTGRIYVSREFDPNSAEPQYVQIRLEEPISCRFADRFIIRNLSPMETIAGGIVIAPFGNRSRKNRQRLTESLTGLATEDPNIRILETVFLASTKGVEADQLAPLVDFPNKTIQKTLQILSARGDIITINTEKKKYLHHFHCHRIAGFFAKNLKVYHKKYPENVGALGSDFFGKMGRMYIHQEVTNLLNWAVKQKMIAQTDNHYHLPDFQGGLNNKQKQLKRVILELLLRKGFLPPGIVNLARELEEEQSEIEKLLKIGLMEKWVVRAKEDIWYHPDIIEQIREKLFSHFAQNETLTVIEFKDLLGISRKHAIGLLEYFDGLHLTRRMENHRILRLDRTQQTI
ncbi:MAG: selenocysteine-specific translation elongation factor [SAR324 cluster bacterium]|nr:selenocysteine-specific translation elongation factor [SAR324 cluster bacterium]